MAATEARGKRPPRRCKRRFGRELPWLAAGLGAFAARDAWGQSTIDARFLFYKESGGRTQVFDPVILMHNDMGETNGQLDLLLAFDTISGASPTGAYPTLDATTSASGRTSAGGSIPQTQYSDTRESATLTYGRRLGAHLPSVDVSFSHENDYTARGVGITDAWTIAQGRGTLHAGFSLSRDTVTPVTNHIDFSKATNGYSLGFTWILTERDLFDVSASLLNLSGYLDDPYKVVPIGAVGTATTVPEHRPGTRSRRTVVGKYAHYYLGLDGALKISYRYYWDDWAVKAHTLELTYDQKLESDWIATPQVRFYTQTGASFYGSLFATPEAIMSADYRLSPLWSILGGLTLAHKVDERLTVSLGATFQSQQGRDRIVAVGSPSVGRAVATTSPADLTVITVTAGLTWRY